jgi:CubicO group peptidase (beta-lactamase class C family)
MNLLLFASWMWLCVGAANAALASRSAETTDASVAMACDRYLDGVETQGFAGVILIRKDDKILLRKGYGFADRERQVKCSPDMVFDLGSITKSITAAAVLKLHAEGKLSIADPLSRFFEGVPPDKAAITLENLLRHTAGFPEALGEDEDVVGKQWLIQRALRSPLGSKPGERFHYSNVGYSLLAAVIEKASGQSYEAYVQKNVLQPARLAHTGYTAPHWSERRLVCGFKNGKPWGSVKDYYGKDGPSWHLVGNGGMLSCVDDLDAWFAALLGYKILPKPLTDRYVEALTRQTQHGKLISITGANNIFSSLYIHWTDENMTLILFTSDSRWPKEKLTKKLLQEVTKLRAAN